MAHEAGKGSRPRPFSVSKDEFDNRFDAIFGKKKKETLPEYELNKSTGEVEKVYPEDIPVLEGEEIWAQQAIDEEQRRQAMKKDGFEE
jgi:hypothetical protein